MILMLTIGARTFHLIQHMIQKCIETTVIKITAEVEFLGVFTFSFINMADGSLWLY